ncbi:MAG TPA: endopeptidase La [Clostridiales bacterium]|nr:MAG: endopeptidase La [Clostridiales bacterium GWD2_32_19]HCC07498.1 endopeptidase La [Clostridiales bacterium]
MSMENSKIPLLKIKEIVLFPNMLIQFDAVKPESINIINTALANNGALFVINEDEENKDSGTIAKIKEVRKLKNETLSAVIEGISRGDLVSTHKHSQVLYAEINEKNPVLINSEDRQRSYKNEILSLLTQYTNLVNKVPKELFDIIENMKDLGKVVDTLAINLPITDLYKNKILKQNEVDKRVVELIKIMNKEISALNLQCEINQKVKDDIKNVERVFLLKKQMEKIKEELGIESEVDEEVEEYRNILSQTNIDKPIKDRIIKELKKLEKMKKDYAERGIVKGYIDTLLELPCSDEKRHDPSIHYITKKLEEGHFGLDEIKERVIEYVATNRYAEKSDNMILCLVGPPGVGKTSIAISIAKSLQKRYVRIPLGGMKDESELRGHRRTYVGAMPGKIISAFIEAGEGAFVAIFDEIDKVSNSFKGDPYSVLLEVFDYEQNSKFKDYYIDVEYDVSNALFICTANSLENIPAPLIDRMEIVYLEGYSDSEKLEIVKKHLIVNQNIKYNIKNDKVLISDNAIINIINEYTREAGIRDLTREIDKIYRKAIKKLFTDKQNNVRITSSNLFKYLGEPHYKMQKGVCTKIGETIGLAWTAYGGKILKIQVDILEGSGQFRFTGKIGQVMNESAVIAHTYLRLNAEKLGIDKDFNRKVDMHIHIPEGSIAKDGPSAGITLLCAMISALKGEKLSDKLAMTGEMTIKGDIIPVGGLKEKITSAIRNNIKRVLIPEENRSDIEKIMKETHGKIEYIFVKSVEEALEVVFGK